MLWFTSVPFESARQHIAVGCTRSLKPQRFQRQLAKVHGKPTIPPPNSDYPNALLQADKMTSADRNSSWMTSSALRNMWCCCLALISPPFWIEFLAAASLPGKFVNNRLDVGCPIRRRHVQLAEAKQVWGDDHELPGKRKHPLVPFIPGLAKPIDQIKQRAGTAFHIKRLTPSMSWYPLLKPAGKGNS
jgi:hypothetical protein